MSDTPNDTLFVTDAELIRRLGVPEKHARRDHVLIPVLVPATLHGQTNERAPTGNWWVLIEGELGLRAVHESAFTPQDRDEQKS